MFHTNDNNSGKTTMKQNDDDDDNNDDDDDDDDEDDDKMTKTTTTSSHPVQVQFGLNPWHLLRSFDDHVINIQNDDLKFFEGGLKFDGSSIQYQSQDETWVLVCSCRCLWREKEIHIYKHVQYAML